MRIVFLILMSNLLMLAQEPQAQAGSTKQDCSKLMKVEWSHAQRGAATADCEFFNASLERGGDAWGDFAAPNALTQRGKGKEEIRSASRKLYANPGNRLSWSPDRSEKFGNSFVVTSGRWEQHTPHNGKEAVAQGRYVTVWQQQPDGAWRYVWDGGEADKEQE
jgi:hypothetical protein